VECDLFNSSLDRIKAALSQWVPSSANTRLERLLPVECPERIRGVIAVRRGNDVACYRCIRFRSGSIRLREDEIANGVVRGGSDALAHSLRNEGAAHERSADAEHEEIVGRALFRPTGRRCANALMTMPDAGEDADFERVNDPAEAGSVFD